MRTLYIFLFAVLCCGRVCAQLLPEEAVRERVTMFLRSKAVSAKLRGAMTLKGGAGDVAAQLEKVYASADGKVCAYDVGEEDGFVIASAEKDMPAVLGYSWTGRFVGKEHVPALGALLGEYERSRKGMKTGNSGGVLLERSDFPPYVNPLVHDRWHQSEPFYNMTPLVDTKHCLTGCVAHAMAEVMNYYNYPAKGFGSHTYTDVKGCGETLTANFSEHEYDWDNILDSYVPGMYTTEQAEAVALLMSDCGISVDMQYTTAASGAKSVRQPIALVNYFGYDRGMQVYFRDFFTRSEWNNMLKAELAEGRPVLISGYSATQAHAFLCDGYDEQGFFHINWGWEGEADGFYNMAFLSPDLPQWYDKNDPERGLNLLQQICVGVKPADAIASSEKHSFAFAAIKALQEKVGRNEAFSVEVSDLGNVGWNMYGGDVGLALKKGDDVISVLAYYDHGFLLEEIDDTAYTDTMKCVLPLDVEEGTYRLVPVFQDNGKWTEARTSVGTPNYLAVKVSADSLLLEMPVRSAAQLTLSRIDFPDVLIAKASPKYSVTLRNDGAEFCGRIYFALQPIDNPETYIVFSQQGLSLLPDEETVREFSRTPLTVSEGKYLLRIFYDVNLFNDSIVMFDNVPDKVITVTNSAALSVESVTEGDEAYNAVVYDMSGKVVLRKKRFSVSAFAADSSFPHGVYVVRQGNRRMKIVK